MHNHPFSHSRRDLLAALALTPFLSLEGCGTNGPRGATNLSYWGTGTLDIGPRNWAVAERDANVRISFQDNGNDLGPVLSAMIGGTAAQDHDLGGVQGGAEPELYRAQTILPWDMTRLPAARRFSQWLPEISYLRVNGQQIGLPIVVNADSIIYRQSQTGTVDSYAAVFDRRFRGRASMEDSWMNSVIFTAIYMKEHNIDGLARILNVGDLEQDELRTVIEFLKRHKRDGQFYKFWSGWEEGLHLISSGRVVVMTGWEPIVYAARERGMTDVMYAAPVEGYEGWSNNLVLHAGVRQPRKLDQGVEDAAYRFANWQLNGNYGCVLGALRGYLVPTDACVEMVQNSDLTYFDINTNRDARVSRQQATELMEHVRQKFEDRRGRIYWQNARPRNYTLYERLWAELRAT